MSSLAPQGCELGVTIPLHRYLCKNKLAAQRTMPAPAQHDLRICWDLHTLATGGVQSLLAVHASSRFAVLLCGPTPGEWADLPALLACGLQRVLLAEGLPPEFAAAYAGGIQNARQTRTHGRRPVAFLNRAADDLYALPAAPQADTLEQPLLDRLLNDVPCRCAGHEGTGTARGFFRQDMQGLMQEW